MVMLNVALVVPVSPSGMLPAPAMASDEASLSVILPTPRPTPTQAPQLLAVPRSTQNFSLGSSIVSSNV